MNLLVESFIEAGAWPDEALLAPLAEKVLSSAARACHAALPAVGAMAVYEISLMWTDNQHIQSLNRQWRGKDKPTNVLSFAANEGAGPVTPLLGDIVLAYETVEQEAANTGKAFNEHVSHLLIHGFLHLLGYDHENDHDAQVMENLEVEILAQLGIADPYKLA